VRVLFRKKDKAGSIRRIGASQKPFLASDREFHGHGKKGFEHNICRKRVIDAPSKEDHRSLGRILKKNEVTAFSNLRDF